jgi:hypothetical protein
VIRNRERVFKFTGRKTKYGKKVLEYKGFEFCIDKTYISAGQLIRSCSYRYTYLNNIGVINLFFDMLFKDMLKKEIILLPLSYKIHQAVALICNDGPIRTKKRIQRRDLKNPHSAGYKTFSPHIVIRNPYKKNYRVFYMSVNKERRKYISELVQNKIKYPIINRRTEKIMPKYTKKWTDYLPQMSRELKINVTDIRGLLVNFFSMSVAYVYQNIPIRARGGRYSIEPDTFQTADMEYSVHKEVKKRNEIFNVFTEWRPNKNLKI